MVPLTDSAERSYSGAHIMSTREIYQKLPAVWGDENTGVHENMEKGVEGLWVNQPFQSMF